MDRLPVASDNPMPYMLYKRHLNSKQWKAYRAEVLARDHDQCAVCGKCEDLRVCHRTFERVGQEALDDCATFCWGCADALRAQRQRGVDDLHHQPQRRQRRRTTISILAGLCVCCVLLCFRSLRGPTTCRDGWHSPSIGIRGVCSHHGGVDGSKGTLIFFGSLAAGFTVGRTLKKRQSFAEPGADRCS